METKNIKLKMQHLKLILSVFLMFAALITNAQTLLEKTLLWQITGPGINAPSYLYGTIHLMCPHDIVVSTELRARFYKTKQLFLELDMDAVSYTHLTLPTSDL